MRRSNPLGLLGVTGDGVDPVCGKTVRPDEEKFAVHDGTVYSFCSPAHCEVFETALHRDLGPRDVQQSKQLNRIHSRTSACH